MDLSTAISLTSAIIALAALGAVIWQGYMTRKHNMLSVAPRLGVEAHLGKGAPGKYLLINMGLGPAIINSFEIELDDKIIDLGDQELVQSFLDSVSVEITKFTLPKRGSTVLPGESECLIEFVHSNDNDQFIKECNLLKRLQFNVNYECMYGRRFELIRSNL